MNRLITTVVGVQYPGGQVESCYALIAEDLSVGAAVTVKRAMELQAAGLPFKPLGTTPDDFQHWFGPDFPPLGVAR